MDSQSKFYLAYGKLGLQFDEGKMDYGLFNGALGKFSAL